MSIDGVNSGTSVQKKSGAKKAETKWRTATQERIYGQRLVEALNSTKNASQPSKVAPSRTIKEAADSALALTAKGQTRWSRAILSRRWRRRKLWLKAGGKIRRYSRRAGKSGASPAPGSIPATTTANKGEKVRSRLRVLARLVPGCRKASTPSLLEEAADYVAALEMQVKAMRMLAERLSAVGLASPVRDA